MFNLTKILKESNKGHSKISFKTTLEELSFDSLEQSSLQLAESLFGLGIRKGDKVLLKCPNLLEFPIIYYAILEFGGVVVPVSPLLNKEDTLFILKDSKAKAFFSVINEDEELVESKETLNHHCDFFISILDSKAKNSFQKLIQKTENTKQKKFLTTNADDTAQIIYTSGTTGKPKGAELSHFSLFMNAKICSEMFQVSAKDIFLSALPFTHIFAQTTQMNVGVLKGVTNYLIPKFEPQLVKDIISKEKITLFCGVPTMYWILGQNTSEKQENSLRLCVSGGASLSREINKNFKRKFDLDVCEIYGMTESSGGICFNKAEEFKEGSVGKPLWGVDVKIVDTNDQELPTGEKGELIYQGHCTMKSYYNKPEETKTTIKDGWLYSGDIAYKDEDGFVFLVDRKKELIIRGGWKIYPSEVEQTLLKHPEVSLAAVVGEKDEKYGQEIVAYVVLNNKGAIEEEDLIIWTKKRMTKYKYPRKIRFVDSLPLNNVGKVIKNKI